MNNEKNIRTVSYLENKDGELFNLYPPLSSEEKLGGIKTVKKDRKTNSQTVAIDDDGFAFVDAQSGDMVAPKDEATEDTQIAYEVGGNKHELVEKFELDEVANKKVDKPENEPVVGKVLKIKSVNEDGTFVCEWADEKGGIILDDIPIAVDNSNIHGLVKTIGYGYGVEARQDGLLQIYPANERAINERISTRLPIVPANLEKAVTSVVDFELEENPEKKRIVEESDLEHYVKDTDVATGYGGKVGLVNTWADYGLALHTTGRIQVAAANTAHIDARESSYRPITPAYLDYAVKSVTGRDWTKVVDYTFDKEMDSLMKFEFDKPYSSVIAIFEGTNSTGSNQNLRLNVGMNKDGLSVSKSVTYGASSQVAYLWYLSDDLMLVASTGTSKSSSPSFYGNGYSALTSLLDATPLERKATSFMMTYVASGWNAEAGSRIVVYAK